MCVCVYSHALCVPLPLSFFFLSHRCLGELVRKMGERVLGRIIPILVKGVSDDNVATRQGVCLGMKEV